ncbi:ferritin-like domain-containing protein [Stenomitos frigidus]|uniref:Rubrerythrin family protein n=1 Tax=Stenomitos frigidus ULC18 TaxID=2107698 RepID=A0A2T1DZ23_9CYAN|nr:ferritin-like domain-containing protein [Stenomitos frigidus]PSB25740.1 rubrerythrin family protein [Stenomitos frigidus ULC18]
MDFFTQVLHLVGSGAAAFITARNMRDPLTRPNTLASLQLAESGSVPYLEALRDRASAEGDTWLAEKLTCHANDERRHGQIFANALKQLNKQVIDFKKAPQAAEKSGESKRNPFFDAYFEGYSQGELKPEAIDWIAFLASTYILELDASKDFVRMANVLPEDEPVSAKLKKGILSVASDETGHAAYLREALERRLMVREVDAVIDSWRTRKVNAILAMVSSFIQKSSKSPSLVQDGVPSELSATPEPALAA